MTLLLATLLALPLLVLGWLVSAPDRNPLIHVSVEHALIVSNVAIAALAAGAVLARTALQLKQDRVLLVALGFGCVAGFFAVHAFSTPGVPWTGTYSSGYGASDYDYGSPTVGLSAYLSVFIPAMFFAAAHTRLPALLDGAPAARTVLVAAVVLVILAFGYVGIFWPELIAGVTVAMAPVSYAVAILSGALLLFAAGQQARIYRSSRLPTQAALGIAYLLLAEAQLSMATTETWTLAWWLYHLLMMAAVIIALAALYLELDRRRGLERFLPAPLVDRVLTADTLRLSGERRVATILFTDLRGSTSVAERMGPEAVVEFLNQYVGAMARAVAQHGGVLDKYMGDGVMAIFGITGDAEMERQVRSAGFSPPGGAADAVNASLQMRRDIGRLNVDRAARGEPVLGYGVGIHTGEVVLGAVGIPERADFTAIGDTVNTAARLERVCKEHNVDAVLSAETLAGISSSVAVRDLGEVVVAGRTQPVRVYALS